MTPLAPGAEALSTDELIDTLAPAFTDLIREELLDENDPDRDWLLREARNNDMYWRGLQLLAAQFVQSLADATTGSGDPLDDSDDDLGSDLYDYTDNIYRGFGRKNIAVLGQKMVAVMAEADDPNDERAVGAARAANAAVQWIKQQCKLQEKNLNLFHKLFNFGTVFAHVDYVVDGDKYGTREQPKLAPVEKPFSTGLMQCPQCGKLIPEAGANQAQCPDCGEPMSPQTQTMLVPEQVGTETYELGGLEIDFHDVTEVSVPLDAKNIDECGVLEWSREVSKGKIRKKYGARMKLNRQAGSDTSGLSVTAASIRAEQVRGSFSSPIGVVRSKRKNKETVRDVWIMPDEFELIEDDDLRKVARQNFKSGVRITYVDGGVVDIREERLTDRWHDIPPETGMRIMVDALGLDWTQVQDLHNDVLNITAENVERSNQPTIIDRDAINPEIWNRQRMMPAEVIGVKRPAGRSISDLIAQTEPNQFSEQIPNWDAANINSAKINSGIQDAIFGGVGPNDPNTARQSELNKNAALMQLGTEWGMAGFGYCAIFKKACSLLGEYEKEQISFGVKNVFGRYDSIGFNPRDLKYGRYHFTFDEQVPMSWGQKRELVMWAFQQGPQMVQMLGYDDPINLPQINSTLGSLDIKLPGLDDRDYALDTIDRLLSETPIKNQGPDGAVTRGPSQPVKPYENHQICARIGREWLISPGGRAKEDPNPDSGFQNVVLWYQAQNEASAQTPPPPKGAVSLTLKGPDLGTPAVQAALQQANIVPRGTQVNPAPPLAPVQTRPPLLPVGPDGMPQHAGTPPPVEAVPPTQ